MRPLSEPLVSNGFALDMTPVGPNGAGKTTTISILTTTLIPTSGTVLIAGYDVLKQARAVRETVGIILKRLSRQRAFV